MKRFGYLLLFLSLGLSAGCLESNSTTAAGDGTVTVSTLTIGGVALTAGSTTTLTSIPTSFDITFSGDVELAAVQSGLTITCEDPVDLTITESTTANTFTVTIAAGAIPQNASCTLALAASISPAALTSKNIKALFEATSYSFTTPCGTGTRLDEFENLPGTGDDGCWTEDMEANWTTAVSDGQLLLTIPLASALDFTTSPAFYKSSSADNIEIIAKIDDITGWDTDNRASLEIVIVDGFENRMQPGFSVCAIELVGGPVIEGYRNFAGDGEEVSAIESTDVFLDATSGESIYLKLSKVGTTVTCSYRVGEGEDVDYVDVGSSVDITFDTSVDVGVIGEKQGATAEDLVFTLDWVSVTES